MLNNSLVSRIPILNRYFKWRESNQLNLIPGVSTLFFYMFEECLFSICISFIFFFVMFFINHILLLAEEIFSPGASIVDILFLLFYSLPSIISFALPFATLVGTLMAISRLSADREVLAFRATGVNMGMLLRPVLILASLLTLTTFVTIDYLIPLSALRFSQRYQRLAMSSPTLELSPFSIRRFDNNTKTLVTGEIRDGTIHNLIIIDNDEQNDNRLILASEGRLESDLEGVISLNLDGVFSHTTSLSKTDEFEYFSTDSMLYNILIRDLTEAIFDPTVREMSARDIYSEIGDKQRILDRKIISQNERTLTSRILFINSYNGVSEDSLERGLVNPAFDNKLYVELATFRNNLANIIEDQSLQIYWIEFHKKFSLAGACLSFVLLAFPIGLLFHHNSRVVGFGIGLFISLLYYGLLFAGFTLGYSTGLDPFLSMWLPNFVIIAGGFILFFIRRKST